MLQGMGAKHHGTGKDPDPWLLRNQNPFVTILAQSVVWSVQFLI